MKNPITSIAVILICFLVTSCIYESAVPIDSPTVKIDPILIGSWKSVTERDMDHENETGKIITLSKQDENNYTIQIKNDGKSAIEVMHGFISNVKGVVFLNVWDNIPEGSPKGYNLMKLEIINDNNIKLYPLTVNIKEQYKSSRELKELLLRKT